MKRLTEAQYRNTIADIFGADIKVAGRFEPIMRPRRGMMATGAALAAISPAGFEEYEKIARTVAAQAVDESHRATLLPCAPASDKAADDACAAQFYRQVGHMLFRRPLRDDEVNDLVKVAAQGTKNIGGFYSGLAFGLAGALTSPEFLVRIEAVEPDPAASGKVRLDASSRAARLSYFLWNSTPDAQLLDAAEKGELFTAKGAAQQIDRMMASPKLAVGVRAFLTDLFELEKFEELAKDPVIYPKFNREVALDSQEQLLRTALDVIVVKDGDYRDLFTTRDTYVTRMLGMVYRIPVTAETGWQRYEWPADSGRAGIASQVAFLAVNSHAGRSSPTLRGKALRETLLCQPVPDPPGDVDFTVAQDTNNPSFKTSRSRLTAHRTAPTCAGCHKLVDPIGLSLENFDSIGAYRPEENGETIDASGDLDGIPFNDAAGLGKALHDSPAVSACLVRKLYEYATARPTISGEQAWISFLEQRFAASGYKVRSLMRQIVASEVFFAVAPDAPSTKTAQASGKEVATP